MRASEVRHFDVVPRIGRVLRGYDDDDDDDPSSSQLLPTVSPPPPPVHVWSPASLSSSSSSDESIGTMIGYSDTVGKSWEETTRHRA